MSQKASLSAIGGFVILGIALVVIGVLYFGSGQVFREKDKMVAFFPGSVQGIAIGSAVEFRGVKVGEVTDVKVYYSEEDRRYDVAVFFDMWPDLVHSVTGENYLAVEDELDEAVINDLGLRARLETKSLVTGQQAVSMEFLPDTPVSMSGFAKQGWFRDHFEVPTVESKFEELTRKIQDLDLTGLVEGAKNMFEAVAQLASNPDLQEAIREVRLRIAEARALIESVRATFEDVRPAAIKTLNQADSTLKTAEAAINEIRPVAAQALKRADGALKAVRDVVRKDSSTRHDLERALQEVADAAEAVRNLAEYINQNPDAFLRGRGQ